MANITTSFQTINPDRLAAARAALTKAREPKKSVSVEDYSEFEYLYQVEYFDKAGVWKELPVSKEKLYAFIENHYSHIIDCFATGEHDQFEDSRTPAEYLQENTNEVLTQFLNHKS